MTTRFYLDTRGASGQPAPVKISVSSKGTTAYIPTNISVLPSQWDKRVQKIVAHPQKAQLNTALTQRKLDIDTTLYDLQTAGKLHGLTANGIKSKLMDILCPTPKTSAFLQYLDAYSARQTKASTRDIYAYTAKKIRAYAKGKAESLRFEDMDATWLSDFDRWMAENGMPMKNARNVYLRNIRTVFNDAIDEGLTECYPFRKFKIRPEPTKSRALTLEQIRTVFGSDNGQAQHYIDMFRLSFCLGGLSFCDLIALKKSDVVNGRIEFRRQKTGQLVSIGIQPEARELLDKYAGQERLVYVAEHYKDTRGYLSRMRRSLQHIGQTYDKHTKEWTGTAVVPKASQYWARYSLATLAAELGFSEDIIGALLGHSRGSVTSIYVRANRNRQVDELMRKVLDTVFA